MQKVVGSNPISRSSNTMANSKRKGAQDKSSHAAGRGGLRRRGRHQDADAGEVKREAETKRSGTEEGADGDPVSGLLETTGKASEEVRQEVEQLLEAAGDASKKIREAAGTEAASGGPVKGNEPAAMLGQINKEVRTVLESADQAAERIREEARADARRIIEENRRRAESVAGEHMQRVSEMTGEVLSQLSAVQGQLETLRRAFDQSVTRMGADLGVEGGSSEVWSTAQNGAEEELESDELRNRLGRRSRPKAAEPEGFSEGARLLALQQLMAGVDAAVIEKRLTEQFGIKDPKPILEWMGVGAEPAAESKKK